MTSPQVLNEIHHWWFGDLKSVDSAPSAERMSLWFGFSAANDKIITEKYSEMLEKAAAGEAKAWQESAQGMITLIILFDQFSRQIYRKTALAFDYDDKALALAIDAVDRGLDNNMHFNERIFCYLPFEHSEDVKMQYKSVALYSKLLDRANEVQYPVASKCLKMARDHLAIIERFGRFPHRNDVLERKTTDQEFKYLAGEVPTYGQ